MLDNLPFAIRTQGLSLSVKTFKSPFVEPEKDAIEDIGALPGVSRFGINKVLDFVQDLGAFPNITNCLIATALGNNSSNGNAMVKIFDQNYLTISNRYAYLVRLLVDTQRCRIIFRNHKKS